MKALFKMKTGRVLLAFALTLTMVLGLLPLLGAPVNAAAGSPEIIVSLGALNWNTTSNNQTGWRADDTTYEISDFTKAAKLVFEAANAPTGGMQALLISDNGTWRETVIASGTGVLDPKYVTVSGNTYTIDLRELNFYNEFANSEINATVGFGYWGGPPASNVIELGITNARLVYDTVPLGALNWNTTSNNQTGWRADDTTYQVSDFT